MWYPASITTPAAAEPVTLEEAKAHLRVDGSDEDALIEGVIAAARAHVEAYCAVPFATQTIEAKCDGFADFSRLPVAPVQSVGAITYLDTAGAPQTLSADVYELRADGLEASIVLKYGQTWPAVQPGSRITMVAVVGYAAAPEDVKQALLLLIGHWYEHREAVNIGNIVTAVPMAVDALLCNHRRGA